MDSAASPMMCDGNDDDSRIRAESPPIDVVLTLDRIISERCPPAPKKRPRQRFVQHTNNDEQGGGVYGALPPGDRGNYGDLGRLTPPTLLQPRKLIFRDYYDTTASSSYSSLPSSYSESDTEYRDGAPTSPPRTVNAYRAVGTTTTRGNVADSMADLLLPLQIGGGLPTEQPVVIRRRTQYHDHTNGEGRQPRNDDLRRRRD